MKSKISIFETNINDGNFSKLNKYFDGDLTENDRNRIIRERRIILGEKIGINGLHIFKLIQKGGSLKTPEYKDGKYILLEEKHMRKKDYYNEELYADVLVLQDKYKNIGVVAHHADCPIIICEDRKKGYTSITHCGGSYIDRMLPIYAIKSLQEVCNSLLDDIYVYIGPCIKMNSYIYDRYPTWATNNSIWKNSIIKDKGIYKIDLVKAITDQLNEYGITHIDISPIDTFSDNKFFSNRASYLKLRKPGENIVGFFYY